jgi:hypothetical protein
MADPATEKTGHGADIPPQDPDHDIDTRRTVTWLTVCTVGVFVCVFVLWQLYSAVIFHERQQKVEQAPTADLDVLRQQESADLQAGPGRKSLEEAMRAYVERK